MWYISVICTEITTTVWTSEGQPGGAVTSSPGPYTVSFTSSLSTSFLTLSVPVYTYTFIQTPTTGTYTVSPTYTPWVLTYNPCEPYLSVPIRILTLDPLWKPCSRGFKGLHDPPVLLNPQNGFVPVTTTRPGGPSGFFSVPTNVPESPAEATLEASAGQSIPQPVVTKTLFPNVSYLPASKLPLIAIIGTTQVTANTDGNFLIGTQSLTRGQQITESGTILSLASDGRELVIGSSTHVLDPAYVIGTKTLSAGGPALTFDGTVISLMSGSGAGGESAVIGVANGQSWTEDASMLTGIGIGIGSETARTSVSAGGGEFGDNKGESGTNSGSAGTGRPTVSAGKGGSGAGKGGSSSKSGSARMKVGALFVYQIVLLCFAELYVR